MDRNEKPGSGDAMRVEKRRKIIARVGVISMLLIMIILTYVFGRSMMAWFREPALFRDWAQTHGVWGVLVFIGLFVLQVVLAFIPGEPLQIAAGMAYGTWGGMALVMVGVFLGTAVVFALARKFGWRFAELFFPREKIESLSLFKKPRQLDGLLFLLFLIPGTPKDALNYAAAFTPITMARFIVISTVARFPAVITSTWGGSAINASRWDMVITIFGCTALASIAGVIAFKRINRNK